MSYLPSIKVALLENISWSNGSRIKPLNPITVDLIAKFETKNDHKINWINDETGLIVLAGDFNYLVYKETEFYTLTKSRVIDAEKLIFVYTVIKDHWQNFINNPNNYVKGCLIKTNEHSILWNNIQYAKAAVLNANYEQVFLTYKESSKNALLTNFIDIKRFPKENGKITKFKTKRIIKSEFEAFKKKLTTDYSNIRRKPNQIISYCPIRNVPGWKNYIAKLIEDFLTEYKHDDPLTLGIVDDVKIVSDALNTSLHNANDGAKVYLLYKKLHHKTDKNPGAEEQKIIREFDLSRIDEIELIDSQTLNPKSLGNKNITDFYVDSSFRGVGKNNTTWILKNKMFSPVNDASHYSYLNVHSKSFTENYTLVNKKLEEQNLKSLSPIYKEHNYNFTENNVPAIFYADWSETISNSTLLNIANNYSTEMGFLLFKIKNFKNTCYKNISNKFVYSKEDIYLTTGIKTPPELLTCNTVRKLSDNTPVRDAKRALFGDIFRSEINKSVWLTLWSSYLWKGDFDRIFEGLSPNNLQESFSYTLTQCYIDENGEVFDSFKQSEQEEQKPEKLPTWGVSPFRPLDSLTEFKKALQELNTRRNNIEINEQINHPFLDEGDIYWNSAQHGFFNTSEIDFNEPNLIVFGDTNYTYFNKSRNQTVFSLKDRSANYGFKFGVLTYWQPENIPTNPNNLISENKKYPKIGSIDTLLTEYPKTGEYDLEKFKRAWQNFLNNDDPYWFGEVYFYDNNGNYINHKNFDWSYNWEQYNNKMDFVTSIDHVDNFNLFFNKDYITLNYENHHKKAYIYGEFAGGEKRTEIIAKFINQNLLKKHFLKDTSSYALTSWGGIQLLYQDLDKNLTKILSEVYKKANIEVVENDKITEINEEELKKHTNTPLLFVFKSKNKPVFYASITWNTEQNKPNITIYLADLSVVIVEPLKRTELIEQANLKNDNLTQVVNQRNFLYVHGDTIELQTKILGGNIHKNFNLRIQNINIEDTVTDHYRALFESEVEVIKKYISKPKFTTVGAAGVFSDKERLEYKIQQDYRIKTEQLERELNKENERLANQNLRNLNEDLIWDKSNFYVQSGLNLVGSVSGALTTAAMGLANPAMLPSAAMQGVTGLAGSINSIVQNQHQLNIRSRNLEQGDIESAFKISHAKRTMDERHKNDEMREKLQLYKLTNNVTSKIPNQADILAEIEKFDGISNGVCIYNRIPTGKLLEYLTQYHENYGYDITVNNYELTVQNIFKNPNKTIYQFLRIDELSISNLVDYEPIKACFLNGIYLIHFEYKLIHVSYLELQRKHREKIAAAKAKVLEAEKAQRKKELDEIEAVSKGVELAKEEYKDKVEKYEKCEEDLTEKTKEVERLKTELEKQSTQIQIYKAEEGETIKTERTKITKLEAKIRELENSEEHASCLEELNALKEEKQNLEKLHENCEKMLRLEKEACKDKDAQIVQQGRNFVTCQRDKNAAIAAKNTAIRDKNTALKEKDDINKNYQTLLGEVAADKTELERLRNENEQLKTQEGGEANIITELRGAIDELTKKKTKLKSDWDGYLKAWHRILNPLSKNTSKYNYFKVMGANWWISTYRLSIYNNRIEWWKFITGGSQREGFFAFGNNDLNKAIDDIPSEYKLPILPKGWNTSEIEYSDNYKGISLRDENNISKIEFYLSSSEDAFERVLSKVRLAALSVENYSKSIRDKIDDFANTIRKYKHLYPNEADAENNALYWESTVNF